ncbi:hypothetical protein D9M70_528230 [compost metagenome]
MFDDRGTACRHQLPLAVIAQRLHLVEAHALRHVAVDEIMRRGLVGHHVGHDAAPCDFRVDFRRIADEADGKRALLLHGRVDHRQRRIEIRRDLLEIADLPALLRPLRINVNAEDRSPRHAAG